MTIIESIKQLYRLLTLHMGSGGQAHANVNTINSGFMTPQQKADLTEAKGLRTLIPVPSDGSRVDVLSLDEGHYWGLYTAFKNTPTPSQETAENTAIVEIDVYRDSTEQPTRKQVYFRVSSNGGYWYINTHYSSVAGSNSDGYPKMWGNLYRYSVLWSGSASTVGTVMQLSDKLVNYSYITISYGVLSHSSTKRFDIQPEMSLREFNIPESLDDKSFSVFETVLVYDKAKPTELTISNPKGRYVSSGSVVNNDTLIVITKIEGVK